MKKIFFGCLLAVSSFFISGCNQADPLAEEIKQQIENPPLKKGTIKLDGLCLFAYVRESLIKGDIDAEKRKTEALAYAGLIEPVSGTSGRYQLTEYGKNFAKVDVNENTANAIFCSGQRDVDVSIKEKINDKDVIIELTVNYKDLDDWIDNKRVLDAYPNIKKIREVGAIIEEAEYRKKDNGEWYFYRPIKSNID